MRPEKEAQRITPSDLKYIAKGFALTLKHLLFAPTKTMEYPEEKWQVPLHFRGRHYLHRDGDGDELCVACFLCSAACPCDCIYIKAAENTHERRVSKGERYAARYDINIAQCCWCGFCEEACPTGAITLGEGYELAEFSLSKMINTKEHLLTPGAQNDERDSSAPGRG